MKTQKQNIARVVFILNCILGCTFGLMGLAYVLPIAIVGYLLLLGYGFEMHRTNKFSPFFWGISALYNLVFGLFIVYKFQDSSSGGSMFFFWLLPMIYVSVLELVLSRQICQSSKPQ